MILFIDTHDSLITVALYDGNKIIEKTQESLYSHAKYLMPMIENILKENNYSVRDINKIVAINGPGSFTGLRIGLSVSKTLAYTLNIPIYLISSLTAYLIGSDLEDNKMAIIEDNKGYYVSVFDKDNNVVLKETYIEDIANLKYKIVNNKLDVIKVIDYALKGKSVNAHLVRANYVKKIEVEK